MTNKGAQVVRWTDLVHWQDLQFRRDTRGVLATYSVAFFGMLVWYFTLIKDALSSPFLNAMHLAAFLVMFKLVLVTFSIVYVKDYLKTR